MRYINYSAIIDYRDELYPRKEHALRLSLRMDDCRCFIVWNIDNMGLDGDFDSELLYLSGSFLLFSRVRTILSNWACAIPAHEQMQSNPFANVQLP